MFFVSLSERTEKVPMGSIKNVVSEPIEGHDEYHMLVRHLHARKLLDRLPHAVQRGSSLRNLI